MKLDKKRYFVINSDVYHQDILVCINLTPAEAIKVYCSKNKEATDEDKKMLKADTEHNLNSTLGTMFPMSKGYIVILKWHKNNFRRDLCTGIHEFTHVSHYILRNIRIPLSVDTEEAYTYLVEDLMRKFLFKLY